MRGYTLIDVLLGILVLSIAFGLAAYGVEQYELMIVKSFVNDLLRRTAMNIFVRKFVNCEICKNMNGFEIIEEENGFVFLRDGQSLLIKLGGKTQFDDSSLSRHVVQTGN